jgi:hypothetical protein
MNGISNDNGPELLKIPDRCHTTAAVLGTAAKMGLSNVMVISELADNFIILHANLSQGDMNLLCDKAKSLLLNPGMYERKN